MSETCFIHVDLDAFYASVEQVDNPEYKGKPVIVGSLPTDKRGVVSTCSYEARAYGVHSAMPIMNAVKLCPHAIFLRGRMKRYQERSKEIMSIFYDFSPDVHQISVDEAFIDISGTERLFGKPIEVAQKLKSKVFEQTGLTVSIGISTTKYIAKIASGIKKPNGLYIVESGEEEKFMLELPLKDIWGIGQKTLARIKETGFTTTKDVHKASESMLINLFGNSTGAFLFKAVRGTLYETFNEAPKTRSISSERTFSVDLTDRYAIDTALMELSWDVMFRLFTEKWTSKTAHIKIRYEDFTTVSVQETSLHPISSADDLFSRAKRLFEKKYENGRGIRLIGIAAQNLEDTSLPIQQDLFDDENKKKTAVEKTVIEMQKKNPGIQIGKARLMKKSLTLVFCFLLPLLLNIQHTNAQEAEPITLAKPFEDAFTSGEAPIAIFNVSPDSPEVEFFAQGTWEAMFSNFTNISGGKEGQDGIAFSFDPPVFIQKTDLTVWFLLQDTWYFEANVADDYDQSTVAAGYYGQNYLKHARIGNRHITFSQDYGVTDADRGVGSGSNQAPGVMAEWSGENWKADALLRYDMTEYMEKTWIGQNESTETILNLTEWEQGARFIFPDNSVESITAVYVESVNTENILYKDSEGTSYKKLSQSEYLLIPTKNMLVLNSPEDDNVLVSFGGKNIDIGSYSPQSGFLGKIQQWFGTAIKLDNFSLPNFFTTIDGEIALLVQKQNFFSPFVDASLYSLSSFSAIDTVSIISKSNGISEKSYGAVILDQTTLDLPHFSNADYFDEKENYLQIFNQEKDDDISAMQQFPFANKYPLIYITTDSSNSLTQEQTDTIISVQSLSQSSVLDIGTDAIQGSITVYRNGIKESLFKYDSNTGLVTLSSPPGTFDTIRITWKQHNDSASTGSLTVALGFNKVLSQNTSFNVSSSMLWPVLESDAYSDSSFDASASVNLALDLEYQQDNLIIDNTLLTSIQTADISDTYHIDDMQSILVEEFYLNSSSAVDIPVDFVPSLNARPNGAALPILTENARGNSTSSTNRDSERESYVVSSEWEITENDGWIAQSINLGSDASNITSAEKFSIWIKQPNLETGFKLYLQLGVSSNEEELIEYSGEIPTWEITSSVDVKNQFDVTSNEWQKVSVFLLDEDRARLTEYQNARIIIQAPRASSSVLQVGSYEIAGSSFSTVGDSLQSEELYLSESGKAQIEGMERFNKDIKNIVQYFEWNNTVTQDTIEAHKFYPSIPFDSYEQISFFAYTPEETGNNSNIVLTLERETEYGTEIAMQIILQKEALDLMQNSWKEIQFDLYTKELFIGNISVPQSHYEIRELNHRVSPTKLIIEFNGSGKLYIDELHLKESIWEFATENILDIQWQKNDVLLTKNDIPIFSNAYVAANVRSGVSTPLQTEQKSTELGVITDSNAKIDILGVRTEGSLIFSSSNMAQTLSNDNASFNVESASHKISSTPVFPVFNIIGFEEEYRYLPQSNGAKKIEIFTLDFLPLGFNLKSDFLTEANQEESVYNQDVQIKNTFNIGNEKIAYSVHADFFAAQDGYKDNNLRNSYAASWFDISKIQFSSGYNDASKRQVGFSFNQRFDFPSIGISPYIILEGENNYTNSLGIESLSSDTFIIGVPFTIGEQNFSAFFSKKAYIDMEQVKSTTYLDDAYLYFDSMSQRTWAFASIPIYDFFDTSLSTKMNKTVEDNENTHLTGYTNEITFDWNRAYSSSNLNIFIPTSASLSASRDIKVSAVDTSDILQLTSNANFLSINNFGKYGRNPMFMWYEQDEIIQSIKASYQNDYLSENNWRLEVSGYNQTSLYFTPNNRLTFLTEGRIDTDNEWSIRFDATWDRDGSSSFLVDGLFWIFPKLEESENGFTRENSLYASLSQYDDEEQTTELQQLYGITHEITIRVNEYAELGLDLGGELFIEKSYFNVQNIVSIRGKLHF